MPTNIDVFTPPPPPVMPAAEGLYSTATRASSPASAFSMPPEAAPMTSHGAMDAAAASFASLADSVVANLPMVVHHLKWKRYVYRIIGGIAILAALISWPILARQQITEVMPSLRGFYENLGLDIAHSGSGLIFDQVKSELRYDGGTMRLYVDGVIHNTTPEAQLIPDIKANALGPDSHVIQSWWVDAPAATVDAGGEVPFHTEINATMTQTIASVYLEFHARDEKAGAAE
ncbi:MAG: hypothetical protein P4M15_05800 [Alphaproteobacteria bacterium]|nr:hypothetical protein [Alphaproteobacteria bacterium]